MKTKLQKPLLATVLISFLILSSKMLLAQPDYTQYVKPFVGTGGHGHTYPGATMPFGMVQLSPDTRLEGWDGCSAYHYSDSVVYGFSHTHLSGTGCSDYGDILLVPTTGDVQWKNTQYASPFSHANEEASPGYYSLKLDKYRVKAEMTVTNRVGFHKYTFPATQEANILIDLKHRDAVIESSIEVTGKNEIRGMRRSKAWASDQYIYFVARFSKPFDTYGISEGDTLLNNTNSAKGKSLKTYVRFKTSINEAVMVKVGISAVSMEGAAKNLEAEIPGWDFEKVKTSAKEAWNKELSKIEVEGDKQKLFVFYTSLYHTMVVPNLFMDVDHQYRGRDNKIHTAEGFDYYTVFSLWDTYRAANPLYTIIEPRRTSDFINTFLAQYDQAGILPVWELSSNETDCMIGYHSVPVIADAFIKGINTFDQEKAFTASKASAMQHRLGLEPYRKYGFVPGDMEAEDVSKTLEYAYDDWCIAQIAHKLGKRKEYKEFLRRGQSYKNLYDPSTGFMRPKINGSWYSPFDPTEVNNHYTEANAFQYSFYVPQDISGLAALHGGFDGLDKKLDELFTTDSKLSGRDQADITGLIGQYAHGNEPSHHMAYLYNYVGKPWKTQKLVHKIMQEMYSDKPDGLCGNEDCGQMSAWYVMSAMGFYQVCPGQLQYAIGTPIFDKVTLNLDNGKKFIITAANRDDANFYIVSAQLNGHPYNKSYFTHVALMNGGTLSFTMGPLPNNMFGSGSTDLPVTSISENLILPVPYMHAPVRTFKNKMTVEIQSAEPQTRIYYTLDGSEPDSLKKMFRAPITIKETTTIKAISFKRGIGYSNPISSKFLKINPDRKVTLNTPYEHQYTAGGPDGLLDGLRGATSWALGFWQGYMQQDFDAEVDLGKVEKMHHIALGCLQDVRSWIWYPREVKISVSEDGNNFKELANIKNTIPDTDETAQIHDFGWGAETLVSTGVIPVVNVRYIRIHAKNYGKCPSWHPGAGGDGHLFVDEIVLE